jgi:hypothetical protein
MTKIIVDKKKMNNAQLGVVNLTFAHAAMKDDKDHQGTKSWIAYVIAAVLVLVVVGLVLYFHPWEKSGKKLVVEK